MSDTGLDSEDTKPTNGQFLPSTALQPHRERATMIRISVLKQFRCDDTNVYRVQWRKIKEGSVPPETGEPEKAHK